MLYALSAVLCLCLQTLSNKEFSRRLPEGMSGTVLFNGIGLTVTAALCACFGGLQTPSLTMIGLTLVSGMAFVVLLTLLIRAYATGPLGITSLIVYSSMLIPVTVGVMAWGESLTAAKIAGIACMLVLFALSSLDGKATGGGWKWLLCSLGAMLLNGALSVVSKMFTRMEPDASPIAYCFWWFLAGAVTCAAALLIMKAKGASFAPWMTGDKIKPMLLTGLGLGVGTAGGNVSVMAGLYHMDASLLIPMVQGGVVLAMVVVSALLYHEKLTKRSVVTVAFGLIGIVLLSVS